MEVIIGYTVIMVIAVVLVVQSARVHAKEQENQLMQAYMVSLQSFYKMIQNRIEMTRRYRHDLAKHIQTLEILMQKQGKDDLKLYAENLKMQYEHLRKDEYCSNEVINTVISIKVQQCREKKIPFIVRVEKEVYASVEDIDMVGILYNLLDNAVEASERIENGGKREIWLNMCKKDGKIYIETGNYIAPGEKIDFKTKKQDRDEHGIGMRVIDYLVQKYGGKKEIQINTAENKVVIDVWL